MSFTGAGGRLPSRTHRVGAAGRRQVRSGARTAAVVVAVLGVLVLSGLYSVFVATARGQALDHAAFLGALRGQGELWRLASPVLDVVTSGFVVAGLAFAIAVALFRRRWVLGVQATIVMAGANLTTQVLKAVLARPEHGIGRMANSFPSGHTTVAASVVAALLVVVPRRWRSTVAWVGGAYTGVTGISVLVGQWHRVSDAVGALVVVVIWVAIASVVMMRGALDETAGLTEDVDRSHSEVDGPGWPESARRSASGPRADVSKVTNHRPLTDSTVTVAVLWTLAVLAAVVSVVGGVLVSGRVGILVDSAPHDRLLAYLFGVLAVAATTCAAMAVMLSLRQYVTVGRER